MLEYNLDAINLKIVKLDASEDDYIGFDWFRDDKYMYFDEIWAKYIFNSTLLVTGVQYDLSPFVGCDSYIMYSKFLYVHECVCI